MHCIILMLKDKNKKLFYIGNMDENILQQLSSFYEWNNATVLNFGTGLINHTWKVINKESEFILQKINSNIFKEPKLIDDNLKLLSNYFNQHHPEYLFVSPIKGLNDETMIKIDENYFRCFPFIKNSHTIDVVQNPQQAYEAANQFAKFTALLNEFYASQLKINLPDFHNLSLRYHQFGKTISNGNDTRITESKNEIDFMKIKIPSTDWPLKGFHSY